MKEKLYDKEFYENQQQGSIRSARVVVPAIVNLIQPKSVVDIGCGVGSWLSVFEECGIRDYLGVDGEYVSEQMLRIPKVKYKAFDLKKSGSRAVGNDFHCAIAKFSAFIE